MKEYSDRETTSVSSMDKWTISETVVSWATCDYRTSTGSFSLLLFFSRACRSPCRGRPGREHHEAVIASKPAQNPNKDGDRPRERRRRKGQLTTEIMHRRHQWIEWESDPRTHASRLHLDSELPIMTVSTIHRRVASTKVEPW